MAIVTKVDLANFKTAIAAVERRELTDAAKEVIGKIKEGILFLEMGIKDDEEAFFIAEVDREVRGLLRMTKRNGVWFIDDLVSTGGGCGGALTRDGIAYAKADYGVAPNKTIELISLNEDSTSFWEHYGFRIATGAEGRRSVAMTLKLPNAIKVLRLRGG